MLGKSSRNEPQHGPLTRTDFNSIQQGNSNWTDVAVLVARLHQAWLSERDSRCGGVKIKEFFWLQSNVINDEKVKVYFWEKKIQKQLTTGMTWMVESSMLPVRNGGMVQFHFGCKMDAFIGAGFQNFQRALARHRSTVRGTDHFEGDTKRDHCQSRRAS